MCQQRESRFFSTETNILGYSCNDIVLYMVIFVVYTGLIMGRHKIGTMVHQLHREALLQVPKLRNLWLIGWMSVLSTVLHIIYVLFITSNNAGFLAASVFAHCAGTILVFENQRADHRHPIRALATSIRNIEEADEDTLEDLRHILQYFKKNKLVF